MKRTMRERAGDFMAGKGFYIVLLLCVTALGVSGYYLFEGMNRQNRAVSGAAQIVVTPTPTPQNPEVVPPVRTPEPPAVPSSSPRPTAPPTPSPAGTPEPDPTPAPLPAAPTTATASVFTWPVKGEVLRQHALETLSYDRTMGDWRTHDGVDISAKPGTTVLAATAGTVASVEDHPLMGTTVVVVTHEKELVNRFSKRVIAIENGRIISDETGGYYNVEKV